MNRYGSSQGWSHNYTFLLYFSGYFFQYNQLFRSENYELNPSDSSFLYPGMTACGRMPCWTSLIISLHMLIARILIAWLICEMPGCLEMLIYRLLIFIYFLYQFFFYFIVVFRIFRFQVLSNYCSCNSIHLESFLAHQIRFL